MPENVSKALLQAWLGPLAALLDDAEVSMLIAHGTTQLWVERRFELQRVAGELREQAFDNIAQLLLSSGREQLDSRSPKLHSTLADGTGLTLIRPPLVSQPQLLIQRVPCRRDLAALTDIDLVPHLAARFLQDMLTARRGILICSTVFYAAQSLMWALATSLSPNERLVCIAADDAHGTLPSNAVFLDSHCTPDLPALVASLRPERLLSQIDNSASTRTHLEVAASTPGSVAAVRAATAYSGLALIEAFAIQSGLAREACHALCAAAFSLVVTMDRLADGRVTISTISELQHSSTGLERRDLFVTTCTPDTEAASLVLTPTGTKPHFLAELVPLGVIIDDNFFTATYHGLPSLTSVQESESKEDSELPAAMFEMPTRDEALSNPMIPVSKLAPLSLEDDPGWEVEVMSRRVATNAATDSHVGEYMSVPSRSPARKAPPPDDGGAFAALLQAKHRSTLVRETPTARHHVPVPPPAHPIMHSLNLEPPPTPKSAPATRHFDDDDVDTDPGVR